MDPKYQHCFKWIILLFIPILIGGGCSGLGLGVSPAPQPPPPSTPEGRLTAIEDLVNRGRDGNLLKVEKDTSLDIRENDSISVVDSGRGELRFPDGLLVELVDQTEVSLAKVEFDPTGSNIFVRLILGAGHTHAELQQEANARLTIETKYATITATEPGTEVLVCHADEVLTCMVTLEGKAEVEAQGTVVTVGRLQSTYIFPDQPPISPICANAAEVKRWLDDKRGPAAAKALGELVAGWPQEPCSGTTPPSALPSAQGMVKIAQAAYRVGIPAADDFHVAWQAIPLAEFWIDQHEVTNAHYQTFLNETGHPPPTAGFGEENHPVKGVTWDDAEAYCTWAKKRLPREAEWEVAARGAEGRLYPWGDMQEAVQLPQSGTYPVGSKLTNQSPFGVFDMAGNVWEWVGEPYAPLAEGHRLLRGGSNGLLKDMAYRLSGDPTVPTTIAVAGFRCAAAQVNVEPTTTVAAGYLYQDSFVEPGSGWPIQAEGISFFGYHPPDFYHVEVGTANNYTVVSRPIPPDNATLETEVKVDHTSTASGNFRYGLVLRRSGDQFYAFTISPRQGVWSVLKHSPAGLVVLDEGPVDSLRGFAPPGVTLNETDTLRVDANGPDFYFHINGQRVVRVRDIDYPTGEVGFFVENFDETLTHIHYDSLTIREVEPPSIEGDTIPSTTPERLCTVVVTPALNLRSGPGTTYPPLVELPNGVNLEPLARSNDGMWIQVRVVESGQMGWIDAEATYISCNVPVTDLPVG